MWKQVFSHRCVALRSSGEIDELSQAKHASVVRAIDISDDGYLLASAGDDKEVHVTCLRSKTCILKAKAPKKISSVVLSISAQQVYCGDKFGDAYAIPVPTKMQPSAEVKELPSPIFGHVCSALT